AIFIDIDLIADLRLWIAVRLIPEAGHIHDMTKVTVKDIGQINAVVHMSGKDDGLRMLAEHCFELCLAFIADPVKLFMISRSLESLMDLDEDRLIRIASFEDVCQPADLRIRKVSLILEILFCVQRDEMIA